MIGVHSAAVDGELECPRCFGRGKVGYKEALLHKLHAALAGCTSADIDAVISLAETLLRKPEYSLDDESPKVPTP